MITAIKGRLGSHDVVIEEKLDYEIEAGYENIWVEVRNSRGQKALVQIYFDDLERVTVLGMTEPDDDDPYYMDVEMEV